MKITTNRVLLAQIRLQYEEKVENDKEFSSKKHQYINVDHKETYYIVDFNGKYLNIMTFVCEYITCDENKISYYGFHSAYGHNVYMNTDTTALFKTSEEAEDYLFNKKLSMIKSKEDHYENMKRLEILEPETDGSDYIKVVAEEILEKAKELGLIEKVKEYKAILA